MSKKNNIWVFIVVAIVFLSIGAGGVYFLKKPEINENNNDEFIRYILRAHFETDNALLNESYAKTAEYQAEYYYNYNIFNLSEIYYSYATEYYGYAASGFGTADELLKQAKNYANSDKALEYITKYIKVNSYSKDIEDLYSQICESKGLACYYYNLSEWDTGDIQVNKANNNIEQLNNLFTEKNNLLNEIDILLETSWDI